MDAGDLVVWIPTKKMVADCLTKHLTLDEETQSIRDLLRTGWMHLRYTDEGEERTLTSEQRRQEGMEAADRESEARPVPPEMDSEDEASFRMHLPPMELAGSNGRSSSTTQSAVALSKHTGVENRTEIMPTQRQTPQQSVRARRQEQTGRARSPACRAGSQT